MARPAPARLAVDLGSVPKYVKREERIIDLDSIPDFPSPVKMEEPEHSGDEYRDLDDIPAVRSFGLKRGRPSEVHTAPAKLQAMIPPRTTKPDHQQVIPKKLDFSAVTEKPVPWTAKRNGDTGAGANHAEKTREKKAVDLAQTAARETHVSLLENMKHKVSVERANFAAQFISLKEEITQKEAQIVRLQSELGALKGDLQSKLSKEKDELLLRHSKEIEEAKKSLLEKDGVIVSCKRETHSLKVMLEEKERKLNAKFMSEMKELKALLTEERERLVRNATEEIQGLKATLEEREEIIVSCKREVDDLKVLLEEKEGALTVGHKSEIELLKTLMAEEKEGLIVRQKRELEDLKTVLSEEREGLIVRHKREIEDLREEVSTLRNKPEVDALKTHLPSSEEEGLILRHKEEIECLKTELAEERQGLTVRHKREIEALKEEVSTLRHRQEAKDMKILLCDEKEESTVRHKREIDELNTTLSIEKAMIEDRHRQQIAAYRSEILTVVLKQTTQNHQTQSSVVQVTKGGTSGGTWKKY